LEAAGAEPLQWPASAPQRITQVWGQTSWAELFGYTEPMLLRDSDAMSMACGLELRVPYLDHQFVEIALRMPQRFQRPGKWLLRAACADLFPLGYLDRPKQGFTLPMAAWMRGPLRELCLSRLHALEEGGWLDSFWISQRWRAFENGKLTWPGVWSLVVLGEFCKRGSSLNNH
jgi:asparagine synthase (glutamine-hydrolysing)